VTGFLVARFILELELVYWSDKIRASHLLIICLRSKLRSKLRGVFSIGGAWSSILGE
jgi:hypothetical protein